MFYRNHQHFLFSFLLLLFSLSFFQPPVFAQEDERAARPSFWVQAGPALTTLGIGFSTGFNAQVRDHYFALKTNSTEVSNWNETWDVSFIYGRHAQINNMSFCAGSGISVLGGTSYNSLFETDAWTKIDPVIGLPLEASFFWHPVNFLGVGMNAFANVNTEQPFGGIGVTLGIGRFNLPI